jgi:hypothetical protein
VPRPPTAHAPAAHVYATAVAGYPRIDPVIVDVAVERLSLVASFGWAASDPSCDGLCAPLPPAQGHDPSHLGLTVAD